MKKDVIDKYLMSSEPLTEDVIAMADLMISMSDDEYNDFISSIDESDYPEWDDEGNLLVEGYILEKPSTAERIKSTQKKAYKKRYASVNKWAPEYDARMDKIRSTGKYASSSSKETAAWKSLKHADKRVAKISKIKRNRMMGKVGKIGLTVVAGIAAKKLYDKAKAEREGCRHKCIRQKGSDKEKCISQCRSEITKRVKAAVKKVRGKE